MSDSSRRNLDLISALFHTYAVSRQTGYGTPPIITAKRLPNRSKKSPRVRGGAECNNLGVLGASWYAIIR